MIIKHFINYNGWERFGRKTTTIGIPMVGGNYNRWELARWKLMDREKCNCVN